VSAILVARDLGYRVGARALVEGVDLEVGAGELLAVVGPNGAGKSTLIGLLAGDLVPHAGQVRLMGRPVRSHRPRELARLRAVMLQRATIEFAFTVEEVVAMGRAAACRGSGPEAEREHLRDCMARAEVLSLAGRKVTTLSGGELARVTMARCFAQDAALMLLDEPTASLDLRHQERTMALVREWTREGGRAAVVVVHDLTLAAAHADRIAVLSGGVLVACAGPWEALAPERLGRVFDHPVALVRHPWSARPLVVARDVKTALRGADGSTVSIPAIPSTGIDVAWARISQIQAGLAPPAATPATPAATTSAAAGTGTFASALAGAQAPTATTGIQTAAATSGVQTMAPLANALPAGPTGQRIADIAQAEVGNAESPPGSNDGPRIADYRTATVGAAAGQPWCAYFASWVANQAGVPIGPNGSGLGYVPTVQSWAQQTGRFVPVSSGPQVGDLVIFDRNGDGTADHIGVVKAAGADGSFQTVEGNSGDAVSERSYGPGAGGTVGFVRLAAPGT
jgi:iron complex transport system ATP-binding protein